MKSHTEYRTPSCRRHFRDNAAHFAHGVQDMKIGALVTAMRPRQWVKNLFVAAPVVFAKHLGEGRAALRALVATALERRLSME